MLIHLFIQRIRYFRFQFLSHPISEFHLKFYKILDFFSRFFLNQSILADTFYIERAAAAVEEEEDEKKTESKYHTHIIFG